LKEVYEYVRSHFPIHTQADFAESLKYNRAYISSAMHGNEKNLTDKLFRNICEVFPGVFDLDYLLTGAGSLLANEEKTQKVSEPLIPQPEVPDYVQRLIDEAVRMSTRNELLERQCEKLIAELREAKADNDTFIDELKKSKEFNNTLAAELKISREQNETLITQLRETRKELKTAIDGIETMKNQMAMMMTTPQSSAIIPTTVNEEGTIQFVIPDVIGHDTKSKKKMKDQLYALVPQGFIRGGRPIITDELMKEALKAFKQPKKK
jgi:transcriptional regulator with XRE-family HTH domain